MAQNATTDDANECDECGTTENVNELSLPDGDAVIGYECDECLAESVEEIQAEQEAEWNAEADAFEGVEVKSDGNLSPTARHVRAAVEDAYEAFVRAGHGTFFAAEPCLWDRGDYGTNAHGEPHGVVFTLPFQDLRTREEFFDYHVDDSDYPEGVEARTEGGYFEHLDGYTFVYVEE